MSRVMRCVPNGVDFSDWLEIDCDLPSNRLSLDVNLGCERGTKTLHPLIHSL
jgi:hypothetical protein